MASVTFDIVRKVVTDRALDEIVVWQPGKRERITDASGHDEVLLVVDQLQRNLSGAVLIEAWKSGGKKADGYSWQVGNVGQINGAVNVASVGPTWDQYMNKSIELVTLQMEQKYGDKNDPIAGLVKTAELYFPVIAKALKIPLPGDAAIGDTDPDDEEDDLPEGVDREELEDMLKNVVEFVKKDPSKARQYMAMLKDQG